MREFYNDIINIRRMVFAAIARIAYEDDDLKKLGDPVVERFREAEARKVRAIF